MDKHAADFLADSLAADAGQVAGVGADGVGRRGVKGEAESSGEARGTQGAEMVFAKSLGGIADSADDAALKITQPADMIDDAPRDGRLADGRGGGERVEKKGIDRKVAAMGVGDIIGKGDGIGPPAVGVRAIGPESRDFDHGLRVIGGYEHDAEGLADQARAAECARDLVGSCAGGDIEVCGMEPQEFITDTAAGEEGGVTEFAQMRNDLDGGGARSGWIGVDSHGWRVSRRLRGPSYRKFTLLRMAKRGKFLSRRRSGIASPASVWFSDRVPTSSGCRADGSGVVASADVRSPEQCGMSGAAIMRHIVTALGFLSAGVLSAAALAQHAGQAMPGSQINTSIPALGHDHRRGGEPGTAAGEMPAQVDPRAIGSTLGVHYFKQWVPMLGDFSRVAVYDGGKGRAELLRDVLKELGLADADLSSGPARGWTYIAVPEAERSEAGVRALIKRLSADERVGFVSPVMLDSADQPVLIMPVMFVRRWATIDAADAKAALAGLGVARETGLNGWTLERLHRLESTTNNGLEFLDAANALSKMDMFEFAETDRLVTYSYDYIPGDPLFGQSWHFLNTGQNGGLAGFDLNIASAWDTSLGSNAITTVIFDTGTQQDHPDLNQIPGGDFTGENFPGGGAANVCERHGTAVMGCVVGIPENGLGTVGSAPLSLAASARIGVTPVTSPCGGTFSSSTAWVGNGLNSAMANGYRVTNHSYGGGNNTATLAAIYAQTRQNGLIHFASAGNSAGGATRWPANYAAVLCVSATNRFGNIASFSTTGPEVDFSAPGEAIITTDRTANDGYLSGDSVSINGTSFSSPLTAGVAALVLSVRPDLTGPQVEQILRLTARDVGAPGYDTTFGYGMPDATAAVAMAQSMIIPSPGACINWANAVSGGPGARIDAAAAFSEAQSAVVFHGGLVGGAPTNETWRLNSAGWSLLSTAGPTISNAGMAYDPVRRELVLASGTLAGGAPSANTWVFDGTTWTNFDAAHPGCNAARLAYDPTRRQMIGIVRDGSNTLLSLARSSSTGLWSLLPNSGVVAPNNYAVAFDERRDTLVVIIETPDLALNVHELNMGTGTWQNVVIPGVMPGVLAGAYYDRARERTMIVTGDNLRTLAYDGVTAVPTIGPVFAGGETSTRIASAYDPVRQIGVLLGSQGSGNRAYETRPSTNVTLTGSPASGSTTVGQTLQLSVSVLGADSGVAFSWRRNGVPLVNGGNISGATAQTVTISNIRFDQSGSYDCVVTGPCNSVTSEVATINVFAPPATELGTLTEAGSPVSESVTIAAGQVQWFRFTLVTPIDVSANTFLDIDSEGSSVESSPGSNNNYVEIGLYSSSGVLIATDDDDGSGLNSQLTFGRGARTAVGDGLPYDGRDGASLPTGTYYLAIAGYDSVFDPANFGVTSSSTRTGTVVVNLRRGVQPVVATFSETEPNDSKAQANAFSMLSGAVITGTSTATSGAGIDMFRIDTPAPSVVVRHRLTLSSTTPAQALTLRGITQTSPGIINVTSDASFATAPSTTRTIQWYGLAGGTASVFVRVTGNATTTAPYSLTLDSTAATITDLPGGPVRPGSVTLTSVGQTGTTQIDTEIIVLDSSFVPIAGYHNDDTPGTTVNRGSTLARNFDAGTYYLAVSNFNTATNLSQANPDEGTQTGNVMDFANVIANSSTTTTPQSVSLLVTDASGPRPVPLTRTAANEVLFVRMIVQAPASCSPADVADTDGQQGGDGTIDNGDFTLFFTAFFAPLGDPQRALADIADTDAVPGADGNVDNGDFTLFFDAFFAGCP